MKKILMSSVVLIAFSVSLIIFQMSCQKMVTAQVPRTLGALNKILLQKYEQEQVGTTPDSLGHPIPFYETVSQFYLVGYNGGTLTRINIPMPAGEFPAGNGVLSPDGEKLIFKAANTNNTTQYFVYSYSLDGSSLVRLVNGYYEVQGAY